MREVAPNDLSGPGYTLHKHDIRRGARGRGFTHLRSEENDLDQEMSQTVWGIHRAMIKRLKAEVMLNNVTEWSNP